MTDAQFEALVARLETYARERPASYRRRVIALTLLGDAYLFGLLIGLVALIVLSIWFFTSAAWVAAKLILVFVPIAWILAKSLWISSSPPDGVRITREQAPELFRLIDQVRDQLDAPAFHHVLIDGEFNAAVVQEPRLGVFGWFTNYLLIGLPLLKSLTPEQFKAVLAHEYGHLAGGHGKLSNWIYRQRLRWSRLMTSLQHSGRDGDALLAGFVNRYAPYLNAYSFPLARANEYEADAASKRICGPDTTAQALTAVNVAGSYVVEKFWPTVYRDANHMPAPERKPYTSFTASLDADSGSMPSARWLDSAMQRSTSIADTHPALRDRLAAIGAEPTLALPGPGQAADRLLGDALNAVTERLDTQWAGRVAAGWRERFDEAARDRERLTELRRRLGAGDTLSFDDLFAHAVLLDSAGDDLPACIAALRALSRQYPDANEVAAALGARLLLQDDESGIALLESVIEHEPQSVVPCSQAIFDYYKRQGRHDEAQAIAERANKLNEENRAATIEREYVLASDVLLPHGLDEHAVATMKQQLAALSNLADVFLVQKRCQHQPQRKHYVLGFGIRNKWAGGRARKVASAMAELRAHFGFPGETSIIALDAGNEAFRNRLAAVEGSRLTS